MLFFPINTTKNGYKTRPGFRTPDALEGIFGGQSRPETLPAEFPTDVQAEIQAEERVPLEMISGLHFESDFDISKFRKLESDTPSHVNVHCNRGLFDDRSRFLRNVWKGGV